MSRVTFKEFHTAFQAVQRGEPVEEGLGDFIKRVLQGGTDGIITRAGELLQKAKTDPTSLDLFYQLYRQLDDRTKAHETMKHLKGAADVLSKKYKSQAAPYKWEIEGNRR